MPVSVMVEGKAHPTAGLAFSYISKKSQEGSQENSNASVSAKKKKNNFTACLKSTTRHETARRQVLPVSVLSVLLI